MFKSCMYKEITSMDKQWDDYISRLPREKQDIYYSREYYLLMENEKSKARIFIYEDEVGNIAVYPFLKTCISQSIFTKPYYDIETAYGYGGPIATILDEKFLRKFEAAFLKYCADEDIIAEFVRFHPLLKNEIIFKKNIQVIHNRYTVWLDLTESLDEIWMKQISTQNRNIIRKCKKNGLFVLVSNDYKSFIEIYKQTMQKVQAEAFYYFDDNYYHYLKENNHMVLMSVMNGNEMIAAAVFMCYGEYCHYHLAGSKKEYLRMAPNNLLLWEAIKYAKAQGCKKLHFGGGLTDSIEDSLFKFKSKFSRERADFYIGKRVHNSEVYDTLISQWEQRNNKKASILLQYKE